MHVLGHGNVEKAEILPHSHTTYYYLRIKIPKNYPKEGEGGASASYPPVEALFKRFISIYLTLQIKKQGGKYELQTLCCTKNCLFFGQ